MSVDSRSSINRLLIDTAHAIVPCSGQICENILISNEVRSHLESQSRYCQAKTTITGSVGKETTLISSDVDIFVFSNCIELSRLEDALEEFADLLQNWPRYAIKDVYIQMPAVKFTIGSHHFDVVPCVDFVSESNIDAKQRMILQQQRTLDRAKESPGMEIARYSPSLGYSVVDFLRRQPESVHDLARLAKFWHRSVPNVNERFTGAKYVMELIAVRAYEDVRARCNNNNNNHLHVDAFERFLEYIADYDNIDIIFEEEYRPLVGHQPAQSRNKPCILDPTNPYDNVGEKLVGTPETLSALKSYAKHTLGAIRRIQFDGNRLKASTIPHWRIIDIFKPNLLSGMDRVESLITSCTEQEAKQYKLVEIRSMVSDEVRRHVEFMQMCLTAICKRTPGDVASRVDSTYKMKYPDRQLVSAVNRGHENFGATICINLEHLGSIVFSFDLPQADTWPNSI